MNVKLVNIPVAVNWCRNYNEVSLTWEMPCLSYMKFLTCQQIWGYVELHILAKLRCGVHNLNIVEGTPWSGVLQVMKNPDEPLVNSSTIFVDSTIFYSILKYCRFTYTQKLQYSSVEGSRGWQGNCQVDTSSHRRNHHYRHNTICCWWYMVVWGSQKVVVHGGAGGQRVYILCNGCSDNARPS